MCVYHFFIAIRKESLSRSRTDTIGDENRRGKWRQEHERLLLGTNAIVPNWDTNPEEFCVAL
jgi:hypothetical protein